MKNKKETEEKIVVLDFGSQYTHLLARRIRQLKVFSEIKLPTVSIDELKGAKGIILSGGPNSVYDKSAPEFNEKIFDLKIPILGLCYGHQLMSKELGGEVKQGKVKEYGIAKLDIKDKKNIFRYLDDKETVWMSHGDTVSKVPEGFSIIASTKDCPVAAMGDNERKYFGFQFHPEVTHTPYGTEMLENFVDICGCTRDWSMHNYTLQIVDEIKERVGDKNVFLLVSGGVDSSVAFALLNKALGEKRVYGLHVNNGFVRKNESIKIEKELKKMFKNFHVVDATDRFLDAVDGVFNPEQKRNIIGEVFIDVANDAVSNLDLNPDDWLLAQGTIYPDTIETAGTKHADRIKTHHNRVDAMQKLIEQGKVIEPLAALYKDEVRELGRELNLPPNLIWKHPFPGPGLAVRVLCAKGKVEIENPSKVDKKIKKIISKHKLKHFVLPIKSVGVQGDNRTYRHPVALYGKADWDVLEEVSTEITNQVKEINRVVYLISPSDVDDNIELDVKESYLTKDRLDLLREADDIAMNEIKKKKLMDKIWQMPVVLVPVGNDNKESIILRPVSSKEAMTAKFSTLPKEIVEDIAKKILDSCAVDFVFYDVTHKPPGTIEWE